MLIQKYQKEWPEKFEALRKILQNALADLAIEIEHIGSTAVPGLAAKPIIDIDIIYYPSVNLEEIITRLSTLDYYHNGDQGISGREVFKRQKNTNIHHILDSIPHHLYACPEDSPELKRHLLFRDYLRSKASARQQYEAIKYEIAAATNQNKKAYAKHKESYARTFILDILEKAQKDSK